MRRAGQRLLPALQDALGFAEVKTIPVSNFQPHVTENCKNTRALCVLYPIYPNSTTSHNYHITTMDGRGHRPRLPSVHQLSMHVNMQCCVTCIDFCHHCTIESPSGPSATVTPPHPSLCHPLTCPVCNSAVP